MGNVATEVVQTTSPTTSHTHGGTPSSGTVCWFDGPSDDLESRCNQLRCQGSNSPFHTITRITADPAPPESFPERVRGSFSRWRGKFALMDPVKLAYLRTSFVFAVSVLVTWTPSSINRIHDLVANKPSFGLNLAASIVLPLQGVWNAVIFFCTSWKTLRQEVRERRNSWRGVPRGTATASAVRDENERAVELERRLAKSRTRDDNISEISAVSAGAGSSIRVLRGGSLETL